MEAMTRNSSSRGAKTPAGQDSRCASKRPVAFTRFTALVSIGLVASTLGCYSLRDIQAGEAPALGIAITGATTGRQPVNDKDLVNFHLRANDPANMRITFDRQGGQRRTQAITGAAWYEIRAIYTEAVVRSTANLADYHLGVKAQPNSLLGYSLNVPPAGNTLPAGTIGVGVLRYAQHPTLDDPIYPSLADKTKAINPVTGPGLYFLSQGILKTDHDAGFPPPVRDVFGDTPSKVVASPTDVQSIKLGMASVEYLLNTLWASGISYTDASGSHTVPSATQDRPLTDNHSITMTRYYKWRIPFSATVADLGSGLPIGRAIFDVRVVSANGDVITFGSEGATLGSGNNVLNVVVWDNGQKMATNVAVALPLPVGPSTSSVTTPEPFVVVAPPPTPRPGRRYSLVATVAGTVEGLLNGPALLSRFRNPVAGAVGPDGSLYVADFDNDVIRRYTVNASGSAFVTTVNAAVALNKPSGVAVDAAGNVYIGDHENASIVKVTPAGVVQTLATGIGKPRGVVVASDGTVYFASDTGHFIGKITPAGQVSVLAGSTAGYADGFGTAAKFFNPYGISLDPDGNILVADFSNGRIRRVTPAGFVTTIAGTTPSDTSNPNRLDHPGSVVTDRFGNVYIADTFQHKIRHVVPETGQTSDLAGTGTGGFADGDALTTAKFLFPYGLAINASGDIFVMEVGNDRIRVIL